MKNNQESYTPQQIVDWLQEKQLDVKAWIDGLAETLQYLALADSCGYEDEKKDAIFQVAGTREMLQKISLLIERSQDESKKVHSD